MRTSDVWLVIEAYDLNVLDEWRRTRAIVYNIARWSGNMKNPNQSQQQFWPLPGDDIKDSKYDKLKQAAIQLKKKAEEQRKTLSDG